MDDSATWQQLLRAARPAPRLSAMLRDLKASGARLEVDGGRVLLVEGRPSDSLELAAVSAGILALLAEVGADGERSAAGVLPSVRGNGRRAGSGG